MKGYPTSGTNALSETTHPSPLPHIQTTPRNFPRLRNVYTIGQTFGDEEMDAEWKEKIKGGERYERLRLFGIPFPLGFTGANSSLGKGKGN